MVWRRPDKQQGTRYQLHISGTLFTRVYPVDYLYMHMHIHKYTGTYRILPFETNW